MTGPPLVSEGFLNALKPFTFTENTIFNPFSIFLFVNKMLYFEGMGGWVCQKVKLFT